MATLSHTESRRLYSWWWDSHISPKNSKWLKENLTDMDVKIKSMIKLIEEDADSFRKRAEMYYRKRPELLKLVEEFYRAYRALAERYDHATGALHQAHQTMAKAFPDQVPFMLSDESPTGSSAIDPNESQEDDLDIPFDSINIKEKGLFSDGNGAIMSNEENVSKSETEIENLRDIVRNLEAEREQSQERVSSLEADISRVQGEFINLNEEMHVGITKLKSVEDQCRLLERENQSFQLELDAMKDKEKKRQEELDMKQEELEKFNSSLNDGHQRSMQAEMAHQSMALEVQELAEKLKHVEMSKISMEEEFQRKMVSLQYEISLLEESKKKLEDEMGVQVEEKKALQQEVSTVKEGKKDLEQRHHELNEQMKAANLNVKLLQELVMKHEDEKTQLLENLKSMENITERNVVLENSLSNANAELEELREKVKRLEESLGTLHEEVSMLLSQKTGLLMQVQAISQNMETVSKKNTLMENSLSDVKIELEDLRRMLNASEESCRSLNDQNSFIVAEKSVLVTKVESISNSLENLEGRHTELEDKYLNLEREKDCILDQVKELQNPVKLEKQEYETLVQSSRNQLAISKDQIGFLQEKDKLREEELEVEHQKIIHAEMEVFILKSCLHDMKEQNMILLEKCRKYVEASRRKEEDIPEVKHVIEDLKTSISDDQDDILRLIIEKSVILTFFKQLVVEVAELKSQKSSLEQKSKTRSEDMELLQANQKFQAILDKNTELHGRIESLGVEKEELEENNLKLLEYHRYRDNEIAGLREANDTLNRLLDKLFEEVQELKNKEMQLTQEVKSSEVEIVTLLKDIQVRTINSAVFEEKMKEKLDSADGENRGMKEELSAYLPLVLKLGDYVSSLEGHILSLAKHHPLSNQKQKSNPSSPHRKWSSERRNEDHCGTSGVGIFELQKLLAKASSLEKVAKDFQGHLYQDRFVPNTSLQADIRDNEGLKSNGTLDLKELPVGKNFTMNLETSLESSSVIKGISKDFIEGSEEMRKDIQLDHVSSPSQYDHCSSSHGPGTNGTDETIELDEMETPLLVTPKHGKELSIDKLNLTSTVTGSHQAWSASTSERLSLDFERLTLLQNSAKELRRNMEISELSKNPTSFQFKKVKAELKEAEGAISQLIDINSKLTKKTERHYSSSDSLISEHNDEIDNISERKISERAQRGSTKIGRLELEMQKLEYIWLKLKEENDYKKAIAAERRTRVLLRDYLYGRRESPRRRKVLCCAFMRPRTKDD